LELEPIVINMHITVHLGLLALVVFFAFAFGLIIRLLQVRALRGQVLDLEKDKMLDHAEILQLQKKLAEQQQRLTAPAATPVVPLKDKEAGKPEEGKGIRATQ
jgi:hypothetical protein